MSNDYLYQATGTATCAVVSTPAPGTTLSSSSVDFGWSAASGATKYFLYVGSTLGDHDIYNQSTGTNLSATVNGIPAYGFPVYVRLWSLIGSTWCFTDQSYGRMQGVPAAMTSPAPNSTLSATSATFQWSAGTGVSQYLLRVGTHGAGSGDIFDQSETIGTTSQLVTGLPSDGSTVYVELRSVFSDGGSGGSDYLYTATGTSGLSTMISPAPSSNLTSASVTFQWSLGTNVTQYWLFVGRSIGGTDIYNQNQGTLRQQTVSRMLSNGRPVYVRLWSLIGGVWGYHDYAYIGGVLFTDQISQWQSTASGFFNVSSGYGTTSTALGNGSVSYPTATIQQANGSWATWCCGYTGNVAYFSGSSSVTITLSGVGAFGFEAEPTQLAVHGMTVTLSNGQTLTGNVNGNYGSQFFGYVGDGITSITITDNSGGDFAIGNFYYRPVGGAPASIAVASADKTMSLSAGASTSSVPATVKCTQACNVK
jgi:hypothetical protein